MVCMYDVDDVNKDHVEEYMKLQSLFAGVEGIDPEEVTVGSLSEHIQFWEEIGASKFVLDIITHGYVLPFKLLPSPKKFKNHKSALCHEKFIEESVLSMLERGCVREAVNPVVCSPLGVVDNGKKLRLILDLRYVNEHLFEFKFKLEDLKTVLDVYEQGDFLITFDLKSGYHHIAMAELHRKYLGFSCMVQGKVRYFEFCVLPFGLSTAPYVFTKVTRPIVSLWRRQGIRCQLYMDDGSGGHKSYEGAVAVAKVMKTDLLRAGFVPHPDKCRWEPSQRVDLLGMQLDFELGVIKASESRVQKLHAILAELNTSLAVSARKVASLAGSLLSMSVVTWSDTSDTG